MEYPINPVLHLENKYQITAIINAFEQHFINA